MGLYKIVVGLVCVFVKNIILERLRERNDASWVGVGLAVLNLAGDFFKIEYIGKSY